MTEPTVRGDAAPALAYGWTALRGNTRPMLAVVSVPVVAQLVLALAGRLLIHSIARWFLFQIVGIVVGSVANIGVARMALMITAGEAVDVGRAFRYDRWGQWILLSAGFGCIEGVGLVLCVIPGVLFLAYFGLVPYFFLDQGLSVGAAFRAGREAVVRKGLAFAVLVVIVVGMLGVVLFVVGMFVTQAIAALALAFLYRHAVDEPVAA